MAAKRWRHDDSFQGRPMSSFVRSNGDQPAPAHPAATTPKLQWPKETLTEPVHVEAMHVQAVFIRWRFADGSIHEFMYTCPRHLSTEDRVERRCAECGHATLILTKFCGHCGAPFQETPAAAASDPKRTP